MLEDEAAAPPKSLREEGGGGAKAVVGLARHGGSVSAPALLPPSAVGRGDAAERRASWNRQVWIDTSALLDESATLQEGELDVASAGAVSPGGRGRFISGSPLSPSAPGSRPGTGCCALSVHSSTSSRPASRRFSPDELKCFGRVRTPSNHCEAKSEAYFQTTGRLRKNATEAGLASLPVLKGKFYSLPGMRETPSLSAAERARLRREERRLVHSKQGDRKLPDEELTSSILNEIYPRSPIKGEDRVAFDDGSRPGTPGGELHISITKSEKSLRGAGITDRANAMSKLRSLGASKRSSLAGTQSTAQSPMGHTLSQSLRGEAAGVASPSGGGGGDRGGDRTERAELRGERGHRWSYMGNIPSIVLDFRYKLLERYATVNEACECLAEDCPMDRGMTKKEWRRILLKQGFEWSNKDKDMIFEELDIQNVGHVTLSDFHIAVEAAAPIRSMEDLRRRWLASGYSSMTQAVRSMETPPFMTLSSRINFEEFAIALRRVNVNDISEHQALFAAVCSDRSGKVSLEELMAAISTVSPRLLLEDLRMRLLKQYGSLEFAYWELDTDRGGTVEVREFLDKAVWRLGMTMLEAKKAFRCIDIDGDGEITRAEFVSALGLAEPSLFLEDLRLKIRRCFRSIQECLRDNFADNLTGEIDSTMKVSLSRFTELLGPLELKEAETRTLFELIDILREGALTVLDFLKGMHHFAPSCVLEDLRVRCMQRVPHVSEAFVSLADKTKMLSLETFAATLRDLELLDKKEAVVAARRSKDGGLLSGCVNLQGLFDLLDVSNAGCVTVGRVVAALQSCGAGSRRRLSPQERDSQACQRMKDHLYPKHRYVNELKTQVRAGANYEARGGAAFREESAEDGRQGSPPRTPDMGGLTVGRRPRPGSPDTMIRRRARTADGSPVRSNGGGSGPSSPTAAVSVVAGAAAGVMPAGTAASRSQSPDRVEFVTHHGFAPRLKVTPNEELMSYMDAHSFQLLRAGPDPKKPSQLRSQGAADSWGTVWKQLHQSPAPDVMGRKRLEHGLHSYFNSASLSMSHDVPLLGVSQSSLDQFQKMRNHKAALRIP